MIPMCVIFETHLQRVLLLVLKGDSMSKDRFPIAEIKWLDARSKGGWGSVDDYGNQDLPQCRSVGYLVKNNRTEVQVLQSVADSGNVTDSILIPKKCVLEVKILRKGNL